MKHLNNVSVLVKAMDKESSKGETENGAVTYKRSGSANLDFFAQAGSMRNNQEAALDLFTKAYAEDRQTALRVLFYLRDIRGGQGERELFRVCLEWLGNHDLAVFEKIAHLTPEYGRWDDLFFDNARCYEIIDGQLEADKESAHPSLLAKWLPTINASSDTTRAKARHMAAKLGMNEVAYRKLLRDIRRQIGIVESQMSARKWDKIDYSKVPSQASRIYKNAFSQHDTERYGKFIEDAISGKDVIKAATLYPYQIYRDAMYDYSQTIEALWNQLPDYTQGNNALVVADVSGSMSGEPMSVAVSLALYFAERNKGQFKDHFITFSGVPSLQKITGRNLREKMLNIENAEWGMNTDLQAVFKLILDSALKNDVPAEDMPSTIYIISDMEFDSCVSTDTNLDAIKRKYVLAGYKVPSIVFWNVNARSGKNLPARHDEENVTLVSGFSPVVFKFAVQGKTPEMSMYDIVNSERYAQITV